MERFQSVEEIQNLMSVVPPPEGGNSFTALLDLPANQAVMLLHSPEETVPDTFFSPVFLANSNDDSFNLVKQEPVDSDSMHNSSSNLSDLIISNSLKRKEPEKNVKSSVKKSKNVSNEIDCEKLPYVYVRAPRGQATDSHSLAERARREKINAKMKFLQELVPGCNKISGTTMVLDEIINHVQSLQHQVEFLSMRLAALHPNININLDSIFSTESGSLMEDDFTSMVSPLLSHQIWQPVELMNPNFITPENSFFNFDSSGNSVSLHTNNLKMEL